MEAPAVSSGLDGIVVADTALSDVDGERGHLLVRGHDVEAIAGRVDFESLIGLLATGEIPNRNARSAIQRDLGAARVRAFGLLSGTERAFTMADGMDALRASLAQLVAGDDEPATRALVLGAMPVYAAAWSRRRRGEPPIAPDPTRTHAADYLRMVTGAEPDAARAAALDAYLVTVADHGMNASTFAARVVASTGSDTVSAIVAAVGALKGPLHGGAPGPVLDMLDAIGKPENAASWLEGEIASGRRIMGMGHRIYRVRDPRAAVLERAIETLERAGVSSGRLALARGVERAAVGVLRERHPARPLYANVEFYTAVLLDAVGLPRTLFSPTFAVGRTAGWLAHIDEQRKTGRLIRPASRYVGPRPAASEGLVAQ